MRSASVLGIPIEPAGRARRSRAAAAARRGSPTACCGASAISPKSAPTARSREEVADEALRREGVDERGLDRLDRAFLRDDRRGLPRRPRRHRRDRRDAQRGRRDARRRRRAVSAADRLRPAHGERPQADGRGRLRAPRADAAGRDRAERGAGAPALTMRRGAFLAGVACGLAAAQAPARATGGLDVDDAAPAPHAVRVLLRPATASRRPKPVDAAGFRWNGRGFRGTFATRARSPTARPASSTRSRSMRTSTASSARRSRRPGRARRRKRRRSSRGPTRSGSCTPTGSTTSSRGRATSATAASPVEIGRRARRRRRDRRPHRDGRRAAGAGRVQFVLRRLHGGRRRRRGAEPTRT